MKKILTIFIIGILTIGITSCSENLRESISEDTSENMGVVTEESKGQITEGPTIDTSIPFERKIIKNGSISLQSLEFNDTVETTVSKIQALGGYVESSNISGFEGNRYASLVVAIPSKNFDGFMNSSQELGNVIGKSSTSQDITDSYVDTERRLKTLETRYSRLLELLNKAGSLEELFKVEQEIGNVTLEIERLKGELQNYDKLVEMSRITIEITEVYQVKPTDSISFGDKITVAFKDMGQNFVISSQNFIIQLIYSIPSIVILGLVVLLGVFGYKKIKK